MVVPAVRLLFAFPTIQSGAFNEFTRSLSKVLVHEGGYSNHPEDPGGATMKGVTQRVYDEYRRSIGLARFSHSPRSFGFRYGLSRPWCWAR
ncbi:glycosyl hydrolase 108 family protein [Rhizobium sp. YTU87027]|uniref:glycosyl hydrolase 108 family protein n=1 Tax=Rhizobium sp. YTU87027 TaxID=3417741 RepID=UPI003D68D58A